MGYPISRRAILQRLKNRVLTSKMATAMARKAGIRLTPLPAGGSAGAGGASVLTIPPVTPVTPCLDETPVLEVVQAGYSDEEIAAFYEAVRLAESGTQEGLDQVRDYLIDLDMEDDIVMDCVMPLLGYDYSGEVCTITLGENTRCPIEIDVTPPDQGFWEQYVDGDPRFTTEAGYVLQISDGQNAKLLVKSVLLATGVPEEATYLADEEGVGAAVCDFEVDSDGNAYDRVTHRNKTVRGGLTRDILASFTVDCFRANYDESGNLTVGIENYLPILPVIGVSSDALLDLQIYPFIEENPSVSLAPKSGVMHVEGQENLGHGEPGSFYWDQWGRTTIDRFAGDIRLWHTDSFWYPCVEDPPREVSYTGDYFAFMTPVSTFSDPVAEAGPHDSDTFRSAGAYKIDSVHGPQEIDFTVPPDPGTNVQFRYNKQWETFDVVAVRMPGRGPSQPV